MTETNLGPPSSVVSDLPCLSDQTKDWTNVIRFMHDSLSKLTQTSSTNKWVSNVWRGGCTRLSESFYNHQLLTITFFDWCIDSNPTLWQPSKYSTTSAQLCSMKCLCAITEALVNVMACEHIWRVSTLSHENIVDINNSLRVCGKIKRRVNKKETKSLFKTAELHWRFGRYTLIYNSKDFEFEFQIESDVLQPNNTEFNEFLILTSLVSKGESAIATKPACSQSTCMLSQSLPWSKYHPSLGDPDCGETLGFKLTHPFYSKQIVQMRWQMWMILAALGRILRSRTIAFFFSSKLDNSRPLGLATYSVLKKVLLGSSGMLGIGGRDRGGHFFWHGQHGIAGLSMLMPLTGHGGGLAGLFRLTSLYDLLDLLIPENVNLAFQKLAQV